MKFSLSELRLPLLATVVGSVVGLGGVGLLCLIALITNFTDHGEISAHEAVFDFSTWGMLTIFIPVAITTAAARAIRSCFNEPYPMLPMAAITGAGPTMEIASVVVGVAAGLVAVGITQALQTIEHGFEKLPIHWMWWPALGGLVVGIFGWIEPRTLGPGYDNTRGLLEGNLTITPLLTLGLFKFLSWSLCLGSGTSAAEKFSRPDHIA